MQQPDRLETEAVLRVGEVSAVTGRRIFVSVDTDKNLSELFFDGDVLRNIAVASYVDIRKGFLSLIGKVEGENAQAESFKPNSPNRAGERRTLTVALVGFLDNRGEFFGGTKELPLVGNEAFLLTKEKVHQVHRLVSPTGLALDVAVSEYEGYDVALAQQLGGVSIQWPLARSATRAHRGHYDFPAHRKFQLGERCRRGFDQIRLHSASQRRSIEPRSK